MVLFTDFTLSLKKPSNLLGFFDADANTIIKALQSRYGIAGISFLQPLEWKAHSKQKKLHQQYVWYRYYFSPTITTES